MKPLSWCLLTLFAGQTVAVEIEWVTVGDPGNDPDLTPPDTVVSVAEGALIPYGAVENAFRIGKFEVTNSQYAEFLNAVAANDIHGLYNRSMDPDFGTAITVGGPITGGILRHGVSGDFDYEVLAGREDKPVNYVSFWDAARFVNWLHNGQPMGGQTAGTTEDGAYTLTEDGIENNDIERNRGATFFLPSQDQWYKAAYYKGGGTEADYWEYPTATDVLPTAEAPPGKNSANYLEGGGHRPQYLPDDLTDVGSYSSAPSPYGTFDQGGNVSEWTDTIVFNLDGESKRNYRGGSVTSSTGQLSATGFPADVWDIRMFLPRHIGTSPNSESPFFGFRVAGLYYDADSLQPGDADQDLDFDQLDVVHVLSANKYLSGQPATWGEGDWDAGPGGQPGEPPIGNGLFDQVDIIQALTAGKYLTGPYAAGHPTGIELHVGESVIQNIDTEVLTGDHPIGVDALAENGTLPEFDLINVPEPAGAGLVLLGAFANVVVRRKVLVAVYFVSPS